MSSQWLVISPGGGIQLVNGDTPQPGRDHDENWAVFKVEADNFGIRINCIKSNKDIVYNPAGGTPEHPWRK